ncbi:MAG: class I SAM-dependent methyltransferase [Bacteroidota bacterium]
MNSFLLNAAFIVQDFVVRPYVMQAEKILRSSNDDTALLAAEAIRDTFNGSSSERETAFIEMIEKRRTEMNSSKEILEITDYGANARSPEGSVVRRMLGEVALSSSKPKRWSLLLFYLIERLMPQRCLEFGTCVGISTMYQSAALTLNGSGTIITMEGAQSLAAVAQKNFSDAGMTNVVSIVGKFSDVLNTVIQQHQPFDFVFVDGNHEGKATIEYFEKLLPSVSRNAVLLFDDIHWSASMKEAWKQIVHHQRVKHSADLYQLGIVIVS